MNILTAKDHAEAFLMVETGRAVAFAMDDILLAIAGRQFEVAGGLRDLQGSVLKVEPYGIMLRRDDPEFKKVVDAATARSTSPERTSIYDKWFLSEIPPKGLNLNTPLGPELKAEFTKPSDSPSADPYKAM